MFRNWRTWGIAFELLSHDGGGGGSADDPPPDPSAHPDYDPDLQDYGDPVDDPTGGQPGNQPPVPPVQPPSRRVPAVAGQDPRPAALTPEQQETRYTTLNTQHQAVQQQLAQSQAQIAHLTRQVQALTGLPVSPAADPAPPMNPKDKAAIEAVYRLFPWMKKLGERADEILGLPDTVKTFQTDSQARYTDLATRMWSAFDQGVTKLYNLQNGQQLHETAQKMLDTAFMTFLETDKNAAARYRMGDTTIVEDFINMYRTGLIVPASRPAPQPGQQPGRRTPPPNQPARLPRGGPGATVVGQQPPQPKKDDVAALHDAAADAFFAARS